MASELAESRTRAAVYVRMSREHQKYSIGNQLEALALYAELHSLTIVRTYADEGISGISLKGRKALQRLLAETQVKPCAFGTLLVYDVSRWGRFQDPDESAHYEYICGMAGVRIIYCAEQFQNDGTPISSLIKSMKRVMAAEYSRELSAKVSQAQLRLAALGYHQGGITVFGLERLLLDQAGAPLLVMKNGQQQMLRAGRVVLVPGPPKAMTVIRRIFRDFVKGGLLEKEIAADLNRRKAPYNGTRPWNDTKVRNILRNEVYIGTAVYNKNTRKMHAPQTKNPVNIWVRRENTFKAIVTRKQFSAAAGIFTRRWAPLDRGVLLEKLALVAKRVGWISGAVINTASDLPSTGTFLKLFGSLTEAYRQANIVNARYVTRAGIAWLPPAEETKLFLDVIALIEARGGSARRYRSDNQLCVDESWRLVVKVLRCKVTSTGLAMWIMSSDFTDCADLCLIARMRMDDTAILDYFLIPTISLRHLHLRLGKTNGLATDMYRFDRLEEFPLRAVRALSDDCQDVAIVVGRSRASARSRTPRRSKV
jgi:DNA invertase Pin-like site-specific DNA recombinase